MGNDIATLLNDLMVRWHRHSTRYSYGKGYPTQDVACRSHRASRQYDDENGALDAKLEDTVMETVDTAIYRLPQPHLTAIQFQARNMSDGHSVWQSPRLPQEPLARGRLLSESRDLLLKELAALGVV